MPRACCRLVPGFAVELSSSLSGYNLHEVGHPGGGDPAHSVGLMNPTGGFPAARRPSLITLNMPATTGVAALVPLMPPYPAPLKTWRVCFLPTHSHDVSSTLACTRQQCPENSASMFSQCVLDFTYSVSAKYWLSLRFLSSTGFDTCEVDGGVVASSA